MDAFKLSADLVEKASLTGRQVECLELNLNGASHRYIARQLGIRHSVVQEHIDKALENLEPFEAELRDLAAA